MACSILFLNFLRRIKCKVVPSTPHAGENYPAFAYVAVYREAVAYNKKLFERCVYQSELLHASDSINQDQFAHKKGPNSTMALIKCQYKWLKFIHFIYLFINLRLK